MNFCVSLPTVLSSLVLTYANSSYLVLLGLLALNPQLQEPARSCLVLPPCTIPGNSLEETTETIRTHFFCSKSVMNCYLLLSDVQGLKRSCFIYFVKVLGSFKQVGKSSCCYSILARSTSVSFFVGLICISPMTYGVK